MNHAAPVFPTADMLGTPRATLRILRDRVKAYLEERSIPIAVAKVGLRYRSFQLNVNAPNGANRVVFIPGVFDGNLAPRTRAYGTLSKSQPNNASVINPRELCQWERPFTVSCWSAPAPGLAADDEESLERSEDLVEQVVRAIHNTCFADVSLSGVALVSPPEQGGFGLELLLAGSIRGPLFDETLEYVQPTLVLKGSDVKVQ